MIKIQSRVAKPPGQQLLMSAKCFQEMNSKEIEHPQGIWLLVKIHTPNEEVGLHRLFDDSPHSL